MSTKSLLAKLTVPTVKKSDAKNAMKKTGTIPPGFAKANIARATENVSFGSHPADRLSLDHHQHFMAGFKAPPVSMYVASDATKPVGECGSDDHLKRITTLAEEKEMLKELSDADLVKLALAEMTEQEIAEQKIRVEEYRAQVWRNERQKGNDWFGLGVVKPADDNQSDKLACQLRFLTDIANSRFRLDLID